MRLTRSILNSSTDRHLFNDLYETILKELQSAGSSGGVLHAAGG